MFLGIKAPFCWPLQDDCNRLTASDHSRHPCVTIQRVQTSWLHLLSSLTTTRPVSVDCSQVATAGNRYATEASFNVPASPVEESACLRTGHLITAAAYHVRDVRRLWIQYSCIGRSHRVSFQHYTRFCSVYRYADFQCKASYLLHRICLSAGPFVLTRALWQQGLNIVSSANFRHRVGQPQWFSTFKHDAKISMELSSQIEVQHEKLNPI